MKKVITAIVVLLIVAVCIVGVMSVRALITAKPKGTDISKMTGGGTLTTDQIEKYIAQLQGEYERGEGPRVYVDGTRFYEEYDGEYYIDTYITDVYVSEEHPDRVYLELENPTLTSGKSIVPIKEVFCENHVLTLLEEHSFGERDIEYEWTDKSEFYYYDIVTDEYMKELEGEWSSGLRGFVIKKGKLTFTFEGKKIGDPINICVVRENESASGRILVANENLHVSGIEDFTMLVYKNGTLSGYEMILDGDSPLVTFVKVK